MTPAERNAVLEEAAQRCDAERAHWRKVLESSRANAAAEPLLVASHDTAQRLAHFIRMLKVTP